MREVRSKPALLAIAVLLLFVKASLFAPGVLAAAPVPTQCNQAAGGATQTGSVSFTNLVSSVTIFTAVSNCNAVGELFIFTVWYLITTSGAAPIPALTLSDNASNGYTQDVAMQMLRCAGNSNTGGNCPGYTYADQIATYSTGFVSSPGHILITIASNANFPYSGKFYASWQFWNNPTTTSPASTCTGIGTYDNSGTPSVQPQGGLQTNCSVTASPNAVVYMFQLYTENIGNNAVYQQVGGFTLNINQQQTFSAASTTNCTIGGPASGQCFQYGAGLANGAVTASPSGGIYCQSACSGVSTGFLLVAFGTNAPGTNIVSFDWNPSSTTQTSGGRYMSANTLYYYTDQNGQSTPGTVINFTSKIITTHCTKAFCYLFVAVYLATNANAVPTSGNPFKLQNPEYLIVLGNTSATQTVSLTTAINIPSGNYWAIAVSSNSTTSRGSGSSGTGVELGAATWASQVSTFTIPGTTGTPPQTMFGAPSPPTWPYLKAQMVFAVTTTTSTATTTITYGTATTTITSTLTTTTNAISSSSPGYWYFPLFYMGSFFGIFAVIAIRLDLRHRAGP